MSMTAQDPIEYLFGLEQFGIKLGLKTIRCLVSSLGSPERTFHTILVAGTNGKGSVAARLNMDFVQVVFGSDYLLPHI